MCDELINAGVIDNPKVSRRGVTRISAAGGVSGGGGTPAGSAVVEKDVEVTTPDGLADAVLLYPEGQGTWPAVLVWTDIMGLRPAFNEIGRRLAAQGYVVLVPNPFYRSAKAPVMEMPIDFSNPEARAKLMSFRQAMSDAGIDSDARAYLAFLDAQPQTDKSKKAGVHGYCMGGSLSFRTAGATPDRIGAVGSFHGGNGLISDQPNSPHLLVPKTNATFLVCHARNDDAQKPEMKDELRDYFAAIHHPGSVEVYDADHGWCVPGSRVYDEPEAERAWSELSQLYQAALA